jgi:hypothetical protein
MTFKEVKFEHWKYVSSQTGQHYKLYADNNMA